MRSMIDADSRPANVAAGPVLPKVGVVAVPTVAWSDKWMGRHHTLSRLADYFHVVWMNPAREWRAWIRSSPRDPRPAQLPSSPGFSTYTPGFWLPKLYRPMRIARRISAARIRRAIRSLRGKGCEHVVLYIWGPVDRDILDAFDFDLTVYHIGDEYSYSEIEHPIDPEEARLIAEVDQVFVHSPALMEKKGNINPHTAFAPNGVAFDLFAQPYPEPEDLRIIPRPRIGYCGWLKKQLDWPLLERLTDRHRGWSFVFVGARHDHPEIVEVIERLGAQANTYFLGAKKSTDLARYPQHFDVCIMPYRIDGYTKFIYPLKVHEYLAAGRPTVGTRIPTLETMSPVVSLASTEAEWSRALETSLEPAAQAVQLRITRQQVARSHDWDALVHRLFCVLCDRLGLESPAHELY